MGRFLGYIGLHWAVLGCIGLYGLYTEQGFTWLIRVVRMIILTTLRNAQCSVSISSKGKVHRKKSKKKLTSVVLVLPLHIHTLSKK